MNGLMAVPNCIAVFALYKIVVKQTNHYVWDKNLSEIDNSEIPV